VVTVEGLATDDRLHPAQEAFIEAGAVQCGFCTPGLVVTVADLVERQPGRFGCRGARGPRGQPVPLYGLREDPGSGTTHRGQGDVVSGTFVIEEAAIATVDPLGTEYPSVTGRPRWMDHLARRGLGAGPSTSPAGRWSRLPAHARSCQHTPPSVPVGHSWLRQQSTLFEWLTEFTRYGRGSRRGGRGGCAAAWRGSRSPADHVDGPPYLFPQGRRRRTRLHCGRRSPDRTAVPPRPADR